jgi:hypothetical protein
VIGSPCPYPQALRNADAQRHFCGIDKAKPPGLSRPCPRIYDAAIIIWSSAVARRHKSQSRYEKGDTRWHPLVLTAKEIGILELLLQRPGTVVSRERILNTIWGVHADPLTNIVEVYIGACAASCRKMAHPLSRRYGALAMPVVMGYL